MVKVNVPELLRAELARPSWKRELVALGTNTDPYQWVESRYRMMPEILEALEAGGDAGLGPDQVAAGDARRRRSSSAWRRRLPVSVNLSVPTLDEKAWRATEPHTPSPAARLDAVAELRRRGIDSGVLIAPLMPGINDSPEQVRPIVERAEKADATFLGGVALHLRDEVKDVFFAWLKRKTPRPRCPRYEQPLQRPRLHAARAAKDRRLASRPRLGPQSPSKRGLADRSSRRTAGARGETARLRPSRAQRLCF